MPSRPLNFIVIFALMLSLFGSAVNFTPARAASMVVITATDDTTVNGQCSLREAIINANDNAQTHIDCTSGSGTDTITFSASLSGTTIILSSSLPNISGNTIIDGSSLASMVSVSGNNSVRVMYVDIGGDLTINAVAIVKAVVSTTKAGWR